MLYFPKILHCRERRIFRSKTVAAQNTIKEYNGMAVSSACPVINRMKNECKKTGFHIKWETLIICLYFLLYLTAALSLALKQPFGNPPDEYNRYLIPQYIARYGTLPNGYEESIRIGGYGFSYAFQPILPYIIQGYCMRPAFLLHAPDTVLLLIARSVNVLFGLIMALFVLLLSKQWFPDKRLQYLFSFLVTFLPQSIFIHTYVNTDSCCMMSIAVILYGLTMGIRKSFRYTHCIVLSLGIIICALSYYNAYGFILSSILLFAAYFIKYKPISPASPAGKKGSYVIDWPNLLKKGFFISALVLVGIGWWFIRSGILYNGDILGLNSRNDCAALYALPQFHPDTRITWKNQGYSVWDMLLHSDFINLSLLSFIGIYGPMTIVTSVWIYRFYKALFFVGILLCLVMPVISPGKMSKRPVFRRFIHANMLFCILVPLFLSIYYSFSTDYQPQGRYLLPMLIPLCYYCIHGIGNLYFFLKAKFTAKIKPAKILLFRSIFTGFSLLLISVIIISLFVTIFGYAYPYYTANPVAP